MSRAALRAIDRHYATRNLDRLQDPLVGRPWRVAYRYHADHPHMVYRSGFATPRELVRFMATFNGNEHMTVIRVWEAI